MSGTGDLLVSSSWRDGVQKVCSEASSLLRKPFAAASQDPKMTSLFPSMRSIAKFALGSSQILLSPPADNAVLGGSVPSCANPVLSCHNTTQQTNLCCFNAPGGQLLQTQFWDTNPVSGPTDSWTVHGLWYVNAIRIVTRCPCDDLQLSQIQCQARPLRRHL